MAFNFSLDVDGHQVLNIFGWCVWHCSVSSAQPYFSRGEAEDWRTGLVGGGGLRILHASYLQWQLCINWPSVNLG